MVSNPDLQIWQQAAKGINESGRQDLTKDEWTALTTLNGSLTNGDFQSDETSRCLKLLKDNLSIHGNNFALQMHLQNFIALYERYGKNLEDTRKKNGSFRTVIIIAAVLIAGYAIVKNSGGISGFVGRYLNFNDNYTLAVQISDGSKYRIGIDSVVFGGNMSNKNAYNNGNFILKLKDIPENRLKPITNVSDFKGFRISDPDTRCYYDLPNSFIWIYNKNGKYMGGIYFANQSIMTRDKKNFKWMVLLYVDRKCEISGIKTNEQSDVSNADTETVEGNRTYQTTTFNLSLKKGWNRMYVYNKDKNTEVTSSSLTGMQWIVEWMR